MSRVFRIQIVAAAMATMLLGAAAAQAQPTDQRWSVDFGIGFDKGISGHINASGIGQLNNQVVVVTKNSYGDVYGSGLHIKFGGGYMIRDETEVRITFTFQSLDADFVTPMGDIGVSRLYGQYTDYQSFGLDAGLRRYVPLTAKIRAYGEGTLGLGFIDETDVTLVAPGANLTGVATDFYDQTAAFSLGANAGVVFQTGPRIGIFGQVGLRYMTGMTQIDNLVGTGLDTINDKSSRWTFPIITGVQFRF